MKTVANTTPKRYRGLASGFIYTFEQYIPCNSTTRTHRDACPTCPGRSKVTYFSNGTLSYSIFCTDGIKGWAIE